MNLHSLLQQHERDGLPIRVGLIGAGRFGTTMYLAQAHACRTVGDQYEDRS